jgi:AmmeMemoRadiSam system protein B
MSRVRTPICADDRWYPRDAAHLRSWLDDLFANVPPQELEGELVALIAPHAGIRFSGQTAAYAYRQLADRPYDKVILLGPSHFADLGAVAVNSADAYQTPLGVVPIDKASVERIANEVGVNLVSNEHEHSLEMQLPFLQRQLGEFSLTPLMMSHPFYVYGITVRNECETLSRALAPLLDTQTILIASSDLSHLHDYDAVTYYDQGFENYLRAFNTGGLIDYMVNEGEPRACGDMAIISTLMAAQLTGATHIQVLHRTNSGDVTGTKEPGHYTVGYLAAALLRQ